MKVLIFGSKGLVGSACNRIFTKAGHTVLARSRDDYDFAYNPVAIAADIMVFKPDAVILAAAKVGGIVANDTERYEFLHQNLRIQNNVIDACRRHDVKKLVFLGSNCIYPREAKNPIVESSIMTGVLEETNAPYALAKLAGFTMVKEARREGWFTVMPCNIYGEGDKYFKGSHVIPDLIQKFSKAEGTVELIGTGSAIREFIYVDDAARAILCLLEQESLKYDMYNLGSGEYTKILHLVDNVSKIFNKVYAFDGNTRYDGTPCKILDCSRLSELGWKPLISLKEGLELAINDYRQRTS